MKSISEALALLDSTLNTPKSLRLVAVATERVGTRDNTPMGWSHRGGWFASSQRVQPQTRLAHAVTAPSLAALAPILISQKDDPGCDFLILYS
ncbi:hypothetical protein GOODEAATRI_028372 [Goodea atripinnis]|uniref:XdhC- CoxI domain-containing protein n=1 Tax=Goodea atripinnis TaxID=208336 RepID=A0ABV0NNW2_9TELE